MTGDTGMRMSVADVHRHAAAVDEVAGRMETARGAAAQVNLGAEAYGQIAAFLPRLIDPLGDQVVTALGETAAALRETATNLRQVATTTAATDHGSARRIRASGHLELPL
ncbi:type VII secretion target [Micromonospora sp. NPDC047134]|uniref:type VII secretion target n=1 Tax=Micromonospora sp. NPDC047134 TaxID=3154340 RepID=UPI0033CD4E07